MERLCELAATIGKYAQKATGKSYVSPYFYGAGGEKSGDICPFCA